MFTINGELWKVITVPPQHPALKTSRGNYALGMCDDITKTIYISAAIEEESSLLWRVLCHEVTHAAMFSYNTYLDHDTEEIVADILGTYGAEIIAITRKLYNNKGTT